MKACMKRLRGPWGVIALDFPGRVRRWERLMNGTLIALVGTAASILSTLSLLPQVIRTWRTRSAGDISMLWLIVALISMAL